MAAVLGAIVKRSREELGGRGGVTRSDRFLQASFGSIILSHPASSRRAFYVKRGGNGVVWWASISWPAPD